MVIHNGTELNYKTVDNDSPRLGTSLGNETWLNNILGRNSFEIERYFRIKKRCRKNLTQIELKTTLTISGE